MRNAVYMALVMRSQVSDQGSQVSEKWFCEIKHLTGSSRDQVSNRWLCVVTRQMSRTECVWSGVCLGLCKISCLTDSLCNQVCNRWLCILIVASWRRVYW